MIEIVPYARFGSVVFGEKSYEVDANADPAEGLATRRGWRMDMDGEFFAWLSQVEGRQASPSPIRNEKSMVAGRRSGAEWGNRPVDKGAEGMSAGF